MTDIFTYFNKNANCEVEMVFADKKDKSITYRIADILLESFLMELESGGSANEESVLPVQGFN